MRLVTKTRWEAGYKNMVTKREREREVVTKTRIEKELQKQG
jgi:hypothetical protein